MGWVGPVLGIASAVIGGNSAKKAADKQAKAAQAGLDWTKQVYRDAQGNFSPYLGLGQQGVSGLSALLGGDYSGFYNSPDYVAAREAMTQSLDDSAAARGRLYSGGHSADLSKYQGNLAAQYLGNYRNSLMGIANMGQNSAAQLGSIGNQNAAQVTQGYGALGQAQAGAQAANGAMWGNALSSLGTLASLYGGSTYGNSGGSNLYTNYGYGPQ